MRDYTLFQGALDLTRDILSVNIEDNIDLEGKWKQVAYYYLVESRKILVAIYRLLADTSSKDMLHPADVLTRSLFEYAVRLKYLKAHPEKLDDFLEHSLSDPPRMRAWGNLKVMSEEVDLLEHYKEFYEVVSQEAHGGVRGMGLEFLRLLNQRDIPDWQLARTLATGIRYYIMIVSINVEVFPSLKDNFAIVSSGTDWNNSFEALWPALLEQVRLAARPRNTVGECLGV